MVELVHSLSTMIGIKDIFNLGGFFFFPQDFEYLHGLLSIPNPKSIMCTKNMFWDFRPFFKKIFVIGMFPLH